MPSGAMLITARPELMNSVKGAFSISPKNQRPHVSRVVEPSGWMVIRPGPDVLTVIDLPVLALVRVKTSAPVASCTMSPFGSGGKVVRTWLFMMGSPPKHAEATGYARGYLKWARKQRCAGWLAAR